MSGPYDVLRQVILAADPRITEAAKWSAPSFATSEHFATFNPRHKPGAMVVLHLGAKARAEAGLRTSIADPAGLLEWRGPDRATMTFKDATEVNARRDAVTAIVRQWITFVGRAPEGRKG